MISELGKLSHSSLEGNDSDILASRLDQITDIKCWSVCTRDAYIKTIAKAREEGMKIACNNT